MTCAVNGSGNLLECAVDAARERATLGEISSALEKVWGRYEAVTRTISGVYSAERRQRAKNSRKRARWSSNSKRKRAAGRASWSPRWGRMGTIAAPR